MSEQATDPASDPSVEVWGRAENGSIARIRTCRSLVVEVQDRWTPLGLERTEPVDRCDLDLTVASSDDLDRLESDLALFTMEHLSRLVAVHAALLVVDGTGVVLPGPSFAGKSTLALAAAEAGVHVVSDEYTLVDPESGLVTGVTRPVRRRREGGVERVPCARPTAPVPVSLVAVLSFGGTDPSSPSLPSPPPPSSVAGLSAISAGEIVMALLANTVCASVRPEDSLRAAVAVARTATGVGGTRGEAAGLVAALLAGSLHVVTSHRARQPSLVGRSEHFLHCRWCRRRPIGQQGPGSMAGAGARALESIVPSRPAQGACGPIRRSSGSGGPVTRATPRLRDHWCLLWTHREVSMMKKVDSGAARWVALRNPR